MASSVATPYQKVNPADQPILYLALSSPTLPLSTVDEFAETLMAQRISMVNGVAQVAVFGSQKYAVRIQLDPDALSARGIGIDQVQKAVAQTSEHNFHSGECFCGSWLRPTPPIPRAQLASTFCQDGETY